MSVIEINHVTKDYGNHKGIFDVDFSVKKGETLGFLGPNGAGKTTTIRNLAGFIRPDTGSVTINGLDCFSCAHQIHKTLGYLPGEIAFMDNMSGNQFLKFMAEIKGMKDFKKIESLKEYFELDASGKIKKMSKGMKQKIGIICAFMHEPEILILDEPTSGLDPLMQNKFIELIVEEKKKGTTILMSSHLFEEVEHTCDRVAIIREGSIIAIEDMERMRKNKTKIFELLPTSPHDMDALLAALPKSYVEGNHLIVKNTGNVDPLLKTISRFSIQDMNIKTQTLEDMFLHFYNNSDSDGKKGE